MLTSHKLLYILPDVAYVTELLPTKKEHTFAIHSFRQINGEFLDDNEFIADNVEKLINKLDADEFHLILPDFLFTNTIVEVAQTDETKVIEYLKSKLLPELTLSPTTHELKTFVLTNHGGKSKVQLSALEKSLMNAVSIPAKEKGVKISSVSPLSWTIKSIVSLEPSISIIQMGSHAYLAQHYIGIDQAISTPVSEIETLSETIKTLKGAEPSIQTVYLISNSLVEEKLKANLSETLPLQQLASFKEEESEMPSYVKFCIEAGMKTLSLDVFPVPRFPLPEPTAETAGSTDATDDEDVADDTNDDLENDSDDAIDNDLDSDTDDSDEAIIETIPTPTAALSITASLSDDDATNLDLPEPDLAELDTAPLAATVAAAAATTAPAVTELSLDGDSSSASHSESTPSSDNEDQPVKIKSFKSESLDSDNRDDDNNESGSDTTDLPEKSESTSAISTITESTTSSVVAASVGSATTINASETKTTTDTIEKTVAKPASAVIKNQSGIQPMLKMLGISFLVFLLTVAIGIGVGRGFIYLTQERTGQDTTQTPVASTTPEPSPSPSPLPSPEPAIDAKELSVLVVNATTKAGYAGQSRTKLEDADFGEVAAGNAKGKYEAGTYVLMKTENTALITLLEETLGQSLTYQADTAVEDPQAKYDAVIVLAE